MRLKFGLRIALTLRPAGPAHPLFDNLELNTFSSRTLQIPLSNPLRLIPLRTLPFCVYSVFHSKFFAFNRLRTLLQNMGGGMGFFPFWNRASDKDASPERAQRAEGSLPFFRALPNTAHESRITSHESRITPLECAVAKKVGGGVLFSASRRGCGPRGVQRRRASFQVAATRFKPVRLFDPSTFGISTFRIHSVLPLRTPAWPSILA